MKPLYILSGDDVRSRRASADEIQEFIDNPNLSSNYRRLGTVTIDANGEIVATPLTDKELSELAANYQADQVVRLRRLLDAALTFRRECDAVRGIAARDRFTIWASEVPWAEDVVRDWAEERMLTLVDDPRPAKSEHWIRTLSVRDGADYSESICTIQWPSIRIGADMMIVEGVELMSQAIAKLGESSAETEPF